MLKRVGVLLCVASLVGCQDVPTDTPTPNLEISDAAHSDGNPHFFFLPPMVPHSGAAKTDVYVVDVFHPVREDFVAMAAGQSGSDLYDND